MYQTPVEQGEKMTQKSSIEGSGLCPVHRSLQKLGRARRPAMTIWGTIYWKWMKKNSFRSQEIGGGGKKATMRGSAKEKRPTGQPARLQIAQGERPTEKGRVWFVTPTPFSSPAQQHSQSYWSSFVLLLDIPFFPGIFSRMS